MNAPRGHRAERTGTVQAYLAAAPDVADHPEVKHFPGQPFTGQRASGESVVGRTA